MLGLTFKENVPDIRKTRVIDVHELKSYGVDVHAHDPMSDAGEARREHGIELEPWEALPLAEAPWRWPSAHRQFLTRSLEHYLAKLVGCFIDVKSQLNMTALQRAGLTVRQL